MMCEGIDENLQLSFRDRIVCEFLLTHGKEHSLHIRNLVLIMIMVTGLISCSNNDYCFVGKWSGHMYMNIEDIGDALPVEWEVTQTQIIQDMGGFGANAFKYEVLSMNKKETKIRADDGRVITLICFGDSLIADQGLGGMRFKRDSEQ